MKIESVNVGLPRVLEWKDLRVSTAFVKEAASRPLTLSQHRLEGDAQADRKVHGGPHKAAYAYPREHEQYWRRKLSLPAIPPGAFGENFSTQGLVETQVLIGERLRFGEALVEISQPRFPCLKMAARFRREDLPHLFRRSGRSGFYLRVLEAGKVAAGDIIQSAHRPAHGFSVHRIVKLFFAMKPDWAEVEDALAIPGLPDEWRGPMEKRWQRRQ